MKHLLIAAREKAGRAVQAARDLGTQIREKQEKGEPVGDLEERFERAHADATAAIKECNRLERELELVTAVEGFREPDPRQAVPHKAAGGDDARVSLADRFAHSRAERMERRRLAQQRELFAKAGVSDVGSFERFRAAHAESFIPYIRHGFAAAARVFEEAGFKPTEAMALLTTQGDLGGFLVADELRSEILKDLPGFTVMRRICRVERTGAPALVFPTIQSATTLPNLYTTGYTGAWKQEGAIQDGAAPPVQNQPRFSQARIPVNLWQPDAVEITTTLLEDSDADVEGIIAEAIAEVRGLDEDAAFLNGTGVDRPLGLLQSGLAEINSTAAAALAYDGLIDMFTGLPAQYRQNAKWLMNSKSYGAILKLKDDQKQPLIPVNSLPNTLWGKGIEYLEFMPDVAANAFPIIFGDFRYYVVVDRQDLRVQRLTERFAPNIGLLPTARVGGQTARKAGFRVQKVAA